MDIVDTVNIKGVVNDIAVIRAACTTVESWRALYISPMKSVSGG
jgi:hypothetical protein